MVKKYIIFLFLASFIISSAFGQNTGDFIYSVNENQITIHEYTGSDKNVIIPDNINGIPVVYIGLFAFCQRQIINVTIPNTVTHIYYSAFSSNKLTSVIIPGSVTYIGEHAFSFNDLTSIIIPDSVTHIENNAFMFNRLRSITLPQNINITQNSFYVSIYARYHQNGRRAAAFVITPSVFNDFHIGIIDNNYIEILLYTGTNAIINIPEEINGLPVVYIGHFAFSRRRFITNVTIPSSVTHIGNGAFSLNDLTNIIIPNSIIHIGYSAFSLNRLTNVTIPNSVIELERSAFDANVIITRQ